MNRVANFFVGLVAVMAVVGVLAWSNDRTDKQAAAMQKYEECVLREYGRTAASWYHEFGELPVCETVTETE